MSRRPDLWPEEDVFWLIELWRDGDTSNQIVKHFNEQADAQSRRDGPARRYTRSAVLAKLNRLGMIGHIEGKYAK